MTGTRPKNLAIYGGSFDPFHNGHLKTALTVQKEFNFEEIIFLPCKFPVLKKDAQASVEQRISMLKLGLIRYPKFSVDLREINRESPSYMVETLKSYRKDFGVRIPVTLILGMDAFKQLPKWYQWQEILQLCNLLVLHRPHISSEVTEEPLKTVLKNHKTMNKHDFLKSTCGKIYCFDAGHYDISSTWLRKQIKEGKDIGPYLPTPVFSYIQEYKLYR
ncbi:nicotinate-nucleotide adenylyltransferase [Legionella londiniensis]|uniref:Probable nicotinate-nucleotide adenylyltransferase n=1 Tax=Legionella londiniensis TaxID=45068 RepID=A0A0W0VN09_9GAMM|nr:nicotinate-nucleotide adenylyltransferase [Legionella londiniensis]KTD21129.1 nicotinate-nucleotide adenylyltransferase NadD [Legionella londiniensis]STX93152.1 nicotinate-nucleotide adenylyltransferase NadD [Legionella londiniensis]